jgi:protein-tyrosine-phosphatase
MKILFVCHGNINRSAAGEIILQKFKPDWEIKSAALKDTNGGEITAKKMRLALTEKGFPTDGIRSTPISKELVDWADVIFYMDDSNEKRLFSKFGVDASKKSIRISSLIGEEKIPDPNFAKDNELHKKVIDMLVNALTLYINDGATNPWIIE